MCQTFIEITTLNLELWWKPSVIQMFRIYNMIQGPGVFSAFSANFFCSAASLLWLFKQRHRCHPSWVCNLSGGVYFQGSVKNTKGGSEATIRASETGGCCNRSMGGRGSFSSFYTTPTQRRDWLCRLLCELTHCRLWVHGQPIQLSCVRELISVKPYDSNITHWILELCDTKIRRNLVRGPAVMDGTQQHGCNYHFYGGCVWLCCDQAVVFYGCSPDYHVAYSWSIGAVRETWHWNQIVLESSRLCYVPARVSSNDTDVTPTMR